VSERRCGKNILGLCTFLGGPKEGNPASLGLGCGSLGSQPPWVGIITCSPVLPCLADPSLLHCSCCGCCNLPCVWQSALPRREGAARYVAVRAQEAEAGGNSCWG
jgi:hypothetical protein